MTTIEQIKADKQIMNSKIKDAIMELCKKHGEVKMDFNINVVYEQMDSGSVNFVDIKIKTEIML